MAERVQSHDTGEQTYKRGPGQTRISAKHQVTIPMGAFLDAGFQPGDAVRAAASEHVFACRRIALDEPAAERAAELRATRKALRMPDALILATADVNADFVLTGDKQWLKTSGLNCELRDIVSGR